MHYGYMDTSVHLYMILQMCSEISFKPYIYPFAKLIKLIYICHQCSSSSLVKYESTYKFMYERQLDKIDKYTFININKWKKLI